MSVMVLQMSAMALGAPAPVQYVFVLVLVAIAAALLWPGHGRGSRPLVWHRAVGAGLSVLFALLHLHVQGSVHPLGPAGSVHVRDGQVPTHDVVVLGVLQAWTLTYVLWTALRIWRLRAEHREQWLRWEHAFMAVGLGVMALVPH